jgi:AcrR family transcriptional regulator
LNEKQLAAVEMLVAGGSLSTIAKTIGVDRRTLYRWRKDEEFLEVLNSRRREVWCDVVGRLRDLTHPSLEVMAQQLEEKFDRTRFRAAALILRLAHLHKHGEGIE